MLGITYRRDRRKSIFNPKISTDRIRNNLKCKRQETFFCIGISGSKNQQQKFKNVNMVRSMYGMANRLNPTVESEIERKSERAFFRSIQNPTVFFYFEADDFFLVHIQNINVADCSIPLSNLKRTHIQSHSSSHNAISNVNRSQK